MEEHEVGDENGREGSPASWRPLSTKPQAGAELCSGRLLPTTTENNAFRMLSASVNKSTQVVSQSFAVVSRELISDTAETGPNILSRDRSEIKFAFSRSYSS